MSPPPQLHDNVHVLDQQQQTETNESKFNRLIFSWVRFIQASAQSLCAFSTYAVVTLVHQQVCQLGN